MSLRLRADDGSLASWAPAAPPKTSVVVETHKAGPLTRARARAVAAAVRGTLSFLGYEPAGAAGKGSDLYVSTAAGPGPRLLVAPSSVAAEDLSAKGFSAEDFHYYCLKTHPRRPLSFSLAGLSAASRELSDLRAAAQALSPVTLEPSSRGVTGYQHRFREALSLDFDFPEALLCLWDGLRPGALSPGSKGAFLRCVLPALGLKFPTGTGLDEGSPP